ncbi:amino acid ABC transporter substrate-binding protein [Ectobacillus sp. JY-23]|uniref:amino acid ABC transporter substrate-binding protein n=1 Tax=Ectobacillus sp. JY-23 TaxID=2933872 RepID=UPI00248CBB86|nr:amino acid ABC transporter substrate-binding protein [Ectobacillus sp. JY-23]
MKKIRVMLLLTMLTVIGGCNDTVSTKADKDNQRVKKVVVGTGTQFPNICFIDKNGKLTGYDVEVVRAIDKLLPEYEFEFKTMEFSNLLLSLETKKIDMIAHNMAVNEERKKKFLFNDETYNYSPLYITVNKHTNDIASIHDLDGKKVIVGATSNAAVFLEKYNKQNGKKIEIIYAGQGADDANTQLKTGRADATLATPFAVDFNNKAIDAQQKVVGDIIINSKVYFLFNKEETDLQAKTDQAIRKLKADGTLKKLSKQWLGDDYSVEN